MYVVRKPRKDEEVVKHVNSSEGFAKPTYTEECQIKGDN